jgi:putative transposase
MAQKAVTQRGVCIRVACQAFGISESCYRYERKLDAENAEVANWLLRLTDNHRSWGFGRCYLYLRNVKGFKWNHKRVIRTLKEQCAHRHRFESLQHASRVFGDWLGFYNHRRPHQSLGMKTPAEAYALAA